MSADGSMLPLLQREITIVGFAGGGGSSMGIEQGYAELGWSDYVDIALNHDENALLMHAANHPRTLHLREDVWEADMRARVGGRMVRGMWLSPDCRHFSKAKGGKPVEKKIRGLAWITVKWAKEFKPRVIWLENVEEFESWGPLIERDGKWFPDPARKGVTFQRFIGQLQKLGYKIEWRQLRGCDYGAPTIRKRLFVIARCDGQPIVWPEAPHAKKPAGKQKPWRTAADCIEWSLPCHSIFLTKEEGRAVGVKRPLEDATMRRIARGVFKFVIDCAEPFIVPVTHAGDDRVQPVTEPLRTITRANGGEFAICVPTLIQTGYGERPGQAPRVPGLGKPLGTCVDGGKHALVAAFLAQHNNHRGVEPNTGHDVRKPFSTISSLGAQQCVVTSHLVKLYGTCQHGAPLTDPAPTVTANDRGGGHLAEVRAFLIKFYKYGGQWSAVDEPMHTLPTLARMGLVIVHGVQYQIVDIGMRMLTPRELARAQGFPDSYQIACTKPDGKPLSKAAQIRMIGNSVCPPVAKALVMAQFASEAATTQRRAA
jgi:DNA (cytosine-5)-methyltransferase 1